MLHGPPWLTGGKQLTSEGGADHGQACALSPAGRACPHAWDSLIKRLLSILAGRESINEYPPEARCQLWDSPTSGSLLAQLSPVDWGLHTLKG